MGRRSFGSIRQRGSGRFQARYRGPDGELYTAPVTYPSRRDAEAFLSTVEADIIRRTWKAPIEQTERLDDYGRRVIARRPLKPQTRSAYLADWGNHVSPTLGRRPIGTVTPDEVRTWHADLSAMLAERMGQRTWHATGGRRDGSATVARCYRILRMVFAQAVEDEILDRSPCRIKGGGTYRSPERPILTAEEVEQLAEAVPSRYRALVLVLAWTSVRLGEATELRWSDVDLAAGTIRVERAVYPVDGVYTIGATKSEAGVRTVDLPAFVVDELEVHGPDIRHPGDLVFATRSRRCAYSAAQTAITRALRGDLGRSDVRVHDLRHTGEVFAAEEGATLAELMERLGHSTVNAAMTYAHAAKGRSRVLADRLDQRRADVVDLASRRRGA